MANDRSPVANDRLRRADDRGIRGLVPDRISVIGHQEIMSGPRGEPLQPRQFHPVITAKMRSLGIDSANANHREGESGNSLQWVVGREHREQ